MAVTDETLRLVRDLRNAVGTEADNAVRNLTTVWVKGWTGLADRWRTALIDVLALQAELQRWPSPWQLTRLEQVQRAMLATERTLTDLGEQVTTDITTAAHNASGATVDREPHILASQLPTAAIAGAAALYAGKVSANALAVDRTRTAKQVARYTSQLAVNGRNAVQRQLIGGNRKPAVTTLLAQVEGGFNSALSSAIDTARVETVDAYRGTARTIHMANADVLQGWSWHCRCALTSCCSCWAMDDGNIHPADEPGPLDHIGGHCQRLPILRSWRRLGYTEDEPPSVIQPARDRFDSLTEADQVKIMGRGRYELLTSGAVQWEQLAMRRESARWRPSYAPTPLRDLQRIASTRQSA
jgi:hypothetical protein